MTWTNLPPSDCLFKILVIQKCILRNISVPLSLGFWLIMQQVVAFLAKLAIIWYPAHAVPHSWVVPEIQYKCVYTFLPKNMIGI